MHALSLSQLISFIPTNNRGFMHFRTLTTFRYRGELSYIVSLRHIYPLLSHSKSETTKPLAVLYLSNQLNRLFIHKEKKSNHTKHFKKIQQMGTEVVKP